MLAFALALDSALSALTDRFDIFLSHSVRDASLVMGVKRILEEAGKTVYVDWISDPNLDRNAVTGATAERLRHRMRKCDACFYLFSRHLHTANELDSCGQNEWAPRATLGMFLAVVNGRQSYSTKLSRPFAGSNRSQKKSWR